MILLYSIPLWLAFTFLIYVPLIILGWILIPLAVWFEAYEETSPLGQEPNDISKWKWHFTWPIMWLWDNWEDGIAAGRQYKDCGSLGKQIIYWSCQRNPVNNLRITPWLSCKINPEKVKFIGNFTVDHSAFRFVPYSNCELDRYFAEEEVRLFDTKIPQWFFAWHGIYSNFYWQFKLKGKLRRFWIGWKIMPKDIYGVSTYRSRGSGFALQWKVIE